MNTLINGAANISLGEHAIAAVVLILLIGLMIWICN